MACINEPTLDELIATQKKYQDDAAALAPKIAEKVADDIKGLLQKVKDLQYKMPHDKFVQLLTDFNFKLIDTSTRIARKKSPAKSDDAIVDFCKGDRSTAEVEMFMGRSRPQVLKKLKSLVEAKKIKEVEVKGEKHPKWVKA